ncbi:MAG: hypothetical protein OIN83_12230 [Candidatus Methanoperedens sp.]|nr:hypothetical protein [Candidatus Methanoperedens sp.]
MIQTRILNIVFNIDTYIFDAKYNDIKIITVDRLNNIERVCIEYLHLNIYKLIGIIIGNAINNILKISVAINN